MLSSTVISQHLSSRKLRPTLRRQQKRVRTQRIKFLNKAQSSQLEKESHLALVLKKVEAKPLVIGEVDLKNIGLGLNHHHQGKGADQIVLDRRAKTT